MVKLESVHGGHNNVAVGVRKGSYKEEVLANALAKKVADLTGARFIPQDSGDVNQNLVYFVREMDKKRGANLSIHFNAFNSKAHGTESYSYRGDKIGNSISTNMSQKVSNVLGTFNRGNKHAPLYVIDRSIDVTTLLEVCFLDNDDDMRKYISKIDEVAHAIASCYDNYKGKGTVNKPQDNKPKPKPKPSKPAPTPNQTFKGFTPENATFINGDTPIQVRVGSHGLNARKGGMLPARASIKYDGWASKDGYIWVHYKGYTGDDLFLPVRPIGKAAWGTFK